jgi:HD-like signal output (HDOD) protein
VPSESPGDSAPINILFVDDDAFVLKGLQRVLRLRYPEWKMDFVTSGQAALSALAERDFDAIVSDMYMPNMDGDELLAEVRRRHPGLARIMLSGQAGDETVLRLLGPVHQFLSKPCTPEALNEALSRVLTLRDRVTRPEVRDLVGGVDKLPSLPRTFRELIEALNSPDTSLEQIGDILSRDVAMTAKLLQLVNSSFFGFTQRVTSTSHAASLLGMNLIKSLVLSVGVFAQYRQEDLAGFRLERLVDDSLRVGVLAEQIARELNEAPEIAAEAALAGAVHAIGQLVLAGGMPQRYAKIRATGRETRQELREVERQALGATHAEIGGYLLETWGLASSIEEAVAFHHEPYLASSTNSDVLAAVYLADVLVHRENPLWTTQTTPEVDPTILARLESRAALLKMFVASMHA